MKLFITRFLFFKFEDSDDPIVHVIDLDAIGDSDNKITFNEFVISSYNEYVDIRKCCEDPWTEFPDVMCVHVYDHLQKYFSYVPGEDTITIPFDYDIYTIDKNKSFLLKLLNPILKECIVNINTLYAYSGSSIYLYFPAKDTTYDNRVNFNIYTDNTFIIDRKYKWGWFTINGKAYVFGKEFRALINKNAYNLGITKIRS